MIFKVTKESLCYTQWLEKLKKKENKKRDQSKKKVKYIFCLLIY